jgi:hypothetical protein
VGHPGRTAQVQLVVESRGRAASIGSGGDLSDLVGGVAGSASLSGLLGREKLVGVVAVRSIARLSRSLHELGFPAAV